MLRQNEKILKSIGVDIETVRGTYVHARPRKPLGGGVAETWYSLHDIHKFRMFSWCSSFWSVRKAVLHDIEHQNILKAVVSGEGTGRKYKIKGENIQRYRKAFESGKIKQT